MICLNNDLTDDNDAHQYTFEYIVTFLNILSRITKLYYLIVLCSFYYIDTGTKKCSMHLFYNYPPGTRSTQDTYYSIQGYCSLSIVSYASHWFMLVCTYIYISTTIMG
jgi:hypothetical protein